MKTKTIQTSMVEIKKEKLAIVLKELLHLKYILNYYSSKVPENKTKNTNENQHKRTNKVDMSTAIDSLQNVETSLKKLKKHIEMLDNCSSNSKDDIYFLILHSKIGYDLNNILYIIELIYKKVYQIFEESYHQYIPKPTLGRRFSNNNLVGNLKSHYKSIIKSLVGNDNTGLILSWSYRNYISLEETHDRFDDHKCWRYRNDITPEDKHDRFANCNQYGAYINLPYWYYEIPTLLPSVAHECVRIALIQNRPNLEEYKKRFEKAVKRYLNSPRDDLSFVQEEIILSDKYNLTNKVVADLISYKIYGNAYIYSLFNDIIGAGLSKLFDLRDNHILKNYDSAKDYIENNFNWKATSYKFNSLRDISIIRLKVLLDYATMHPSTCTDYIREMKELLETIITSEEEKNGLESIYENHPHYKDSFLVLKSAILNISKLYTDEAYELGLIFLKDLGDIENINFQKLWDKHFKENIHKNELRKLLHEETLENIKNSISDPEEKKRIDEIGTPYSLVFIKMLKKIYCNSLQGTVGEEKYHKCLDSTINKCFNNEQYYHAFGIYDLAILKDTSEYPKDPDKTIEEKFDKIDELNNGDKERYYESRFSLMQTYPTIKGTNKEINSNVSIMYNIDLTTKNNSAGEALAESICSIAKKIKKNIVSFREVKIFKTLGPGDLIVLVDGVSNSNFLMLTEKVLALPFIKRTFTTVLAEKDKKDKIIPQNDYQIVSFIRLDISGVETLEKIVRNVLSKDIEKHIESINFTSGVLDLEIKWEAKTSVEIVMNFYNILMEKSYVRDFQTKFNKNYALKKDSRCMIIPLDRDGPAR